MRCSFCSVIPHTAREHPTEAKLHYPFHPQFGEAVIVRRRLVTKKVEMANGRKRVRRGVRRAISEWDVLIKDHHDGYISWEEFERNQRVIADNAMSKGSAIVKGAVRKGEVLLAGLLRCGHCGRKLHVHYSSNIGRYTCYGARANHGTLYLDRQPED